MPDGVWIPEHLTRVGPPIFATDVMATSDGDTPMQSNFKRRRKPGKGTYDEIIVKTRRKRGHGKIGAHSPYGDDPLDDDGIVDDDLLPEGDDPFDDLLPPPPPTPPEPTECDFAREAMQDAAAELAAARADLAEKVGRARRFQQGLWGSDGAPAGYQFPSVYKYEMIATAQGRRDEAVDALEAAIETFEKLGCKDGH